MVLVLHREASTFLLIWIAFFPSLQKQLIIGCSKILFDNLKHVIVKMKDLKQNFSTVVDWWYRTSKTKDTL